MLASVETSEGGGAVSPNNFRLAKCDALFISISSQEAKKNSIGSKSLIGREL